MQLTLSTFDRYISLGIYDRSITHLNIKYSITIFDKCDHIMCIIHSYNPAQPRATSLYTTLGSAQKYSTTVALDTDEESLADFIGGLSSST